MNVRRCYTILGLGPNASLDEVKSAFRKLAFTLHPDLNPAPEAGEKFREVNEAYVLLSRTLAQESRTGYASHTAGPQPEQAPPKANPSDAAGAYARQERQAERNPPPPPPPPGGRTRTASAGNQEDLLRDLLKDPFARKVFEDIYQEVRTKRPDSWPSKQLRDRRLELRWGNRRFSLDLSRGMFGGIKHWFRKQFDEERTMHFPAGMLFPGRTLRISVHRRFAGRAKTVAVTLPPDFAPGKPIRLKGLGKKLGPMAGDLILRLLPR